MNGSPAQAVELVHQCRLGVTETLHRSERHTKHEKKFSQRVIENWWDDEIALQCQGFCGRQVHAPCVTGQCGTMKIGERGQGWFYTSAAKYSELQHHKGKFQILISEQLMDLIYAMESLNHSISCSTVENSI